MDSVTYFALMELLQAVTYIYIDLCDNPSNQILTLLGYIHVAFQPFFVNMVAMYFIPVSVKLKIRTTVYTICAIGSIAMLIKMYPFGWAGSCHIGVEGFAAPVFVQLPVPGISLANAFKWSYVGSG